MDVELSELCQQSVSIAFQTGVVNNAAKPGYGAPVTFAARLENKTQYRMLPNGDVVETKGVIYLVPIDGTTVPRAGIDLVTLPSTEAVRQPKILDVETEVDELGALYYIKLYF